MLPITLSSLLMLRDNKLGIASIRIGHKFLLERFLLFVAIILWSLILALFVYLYKNERFLGRVQSRIWKFHKNRKISTVVGHPYKVRNPWYKMQEVLDDKNKPLIEDKKEKFPKIFEESISGDVCEAILTMVHQKLNKNVEIGNPLFVQESKKEVAKDESEKNLRNRD